MQNLLYLVWDGRLVFLCGFLFLFVCPLTYGFVFPFTESPPMATPSSSSGGGAEDSVQRSLQTKRLRTEDKKDEDKKEEARQVIILPPSCAVEIYTSFVYMRGRGGGGGVGYLPCVAL
jgi:hypothetical protein